MVCSCAALQFRLTSVCLWLGSARVVDVVSRLGIGCPTSSAFRQETTRLTSFSRQQQPWKITSAAVFVDNYQHQRKSTSRARADKRLRVNSRIVEIVFSVPSSHSLARAQFEHGLRQSPPPALSPAVFECNDRDCAALADFSERNMLETMANLLLSSTDPVRRLLAIREALHEDSVSAKCCTNRACVGHMGPLYNSLKRKCDVSSDAIEYCVVLRSQLMNLLFCTVFMSHGCIFG